VKKRKHIRRKNAYNCRQQVKNNRSVVHYLNSTSPCSAPGYYLYLRSNDEIDDGYLPTFCGMRLGVFAHCQCPYEPHFYCTYVDVDIARITCFGNYELSRFK
jgi:hypothetical protein